MCSEAFDPDVHDAVPRRLSAHACVFRLLKYDTADDDYLSNLPSDFAKYALRMCHAPSEAIMTISTLLFSQETIAKYLKPYITLVMACAVFTQ